MFDWLQFLEQHNIDYVAAKDDVNVKCPFCTDDPSHHLGISLRGRGWNCWRNAMHHGKSRAHLIQGLLSCDPDEARLLAYGEIGPALLPDNSLSSAIRKRLGETVATNQPLVLPKEFRPLTQTPSVFARPVINYLMRRGYSGRQLEWVLKTYELHYAMRGKYAYRVIVPVRDRNGHLLTWTARSILPDVTERYLTLSKQEHVKPTSDLLLGMPLLWRVNNPKVLIVCEGPFDAMWVTAFGRSFGVYATCLFGLRMSAAQIGLLSELGEYFPRLYLLVDTAAQTQAFRLSQAGIDLKPLYPPMTAKDPAEMSPESVIKLCLSVL